MICLRDQIQYENVISKRYQFHYKDFEDKMVEFLNDILKLKLYPNGKIFYCLNNVPLDEIMMIEFFLPIKGEPLQLNKDMRFHSYFSVENMMSLRVTGDINSKMEEAYSAILELMKVENLTQITPIFHIIDKIDNTGFLTIKVGYTQKDNTI